MLGAPVYYFRTIRSLVTAFGSLFNDMVMVKYDNTMRNEISRLTVPLTYMGKENFITRLLDNPDLAKPAEITLPRASFAITSYAYDKTRKLNTFNSTALPTTGSGALQQYQAVPWNIGFELYLYVRNVEDGTQLIEQILPVFVPDYTLSINYIPELSIVRNAPITLTGVDCSTQFEGDNEQERVIIWTLGFNVQAQFFGPITSGNVITQVINNLYINTALGTDGLPADVELILANTGTGSYQINEVVYQGGQLPDATATGVVSAYNANANTLVVVSVQGNFTTGPAVIGVNSGAQFVVAQTSPNIEVATINITPSPNTANADTAFGWDIQITEYPETL